MRHSQTNGHNNTVKENNMASRIQEGGGGMGSSRSVRVVKSTSSLARDIKNIKETGKVLSAKEGTAAKAGAKKVVKGKPAKVIKIK